MPGRAVNDQPDLDLLCFEPYVPGYLARDVFRFLRAELPFYRVKYTIKRGAVETNINTPRYTTVFGLDDTSRFAPRAPSSATTEHNLGESGSGSGSDLGKGNGNGNSDTIIVDAKTGAPVAPSAYARYAPRPIPACLDDLRRSAEAATGARFNFCLVNYYASGSDSISYHSDDERFLGPEPAIASFSFGARRDFLMKHKPPAAAAREQQQQQPGAAPPAEAKPLKLALGSGDMIFMRGRTQACWLHSIPKRTGKNEKDGGRINITFRKAMVKGGTDNYYNYNVGTGPVYKWNEAAREMQMWNP